MDLDAIATTLRERRADLVAEVGRLTEAPEPGATVGFGKRIGDGTAEAVERFNTTAAARSVTKSLADVDRALAKIADGTYGMCDRCGEPIPQPRLAALPATARCVSCAAAS
jgi:DnaK suppressor protein